MSSLLMNSSYHDRIRIANMLRSPNLITIKNGRLVENPVIDYSILTNKFKMDNPNLFHDIGCIYNAVEFGNVGMNLYEVEHTIVLNGRDLSFGYAPYFNSDMVVEDVYLDNTIAPIEDLLAELERQVNYEGDTTGVGIDMNDYIEPAPAELTGKELENFYRKQFIEKQKMEDDLYNDTDPFFED